MEGGGDMEEQEHEEEQRSMGGRHHHDDLEESKDTLNNRSFRDDHYDNIPVKNRVAKNSEDLIVPAHNLKKPIDFNLVGDDDFAGWQ